MTNTPTEDRGVVVGLPNPKHRVHVAPNASPKDVPNSVFLAGSIEMGTAINWQKQVTLALDTNLPDHHLTIFNPRRPDWGTGWPQDPNFAPFREQVEWELDAQDKVDVIAMYIDPNTKAPISLLELGLYAASKKMVVCCPKGFWRRGNVQLVCERHGIPVLESLEEFITEVTKKVKARG